MNGVRMAFHGTNGHQPTGAVGKLDRVRVVAVADMAEEALAGLKEKMPDTYGDARRYESLDELLGKAAPDLISIASARRDQQHEHTVQALEAGAHVYAEKPLATTMAGLDAIRAAAERTGREVRSMTGMLYAPVFREIKELVDAGRLGQVVQVFAQKSYPYHDRRPQDNGVDGGLIRQASTHAISFVRYVTGLEFEEVFTLGTGLGNPREGELQMASQASARLTGGALCTLVLNYCNPKGIGFWGNDQLRVHGTGGMVETTDAGTRSVVAIGDDKPTTLAHPEMLGGYEELLADYVSHLLDGSDMLLSQDDSFMISQVAIRAQESADSGTPVRV